METMRLGGNVSQFLGLIGSVVAAAPADYMQYF
jgi:hypothetical protein